MKLTTIATVALAALLVSAGAAAAMPGDAPSDAPPDEYASAADRPDDAGAEAATGDDGSDAADAAAGSQGAGPPSDLPAPVPDHVGRIHQLVADFLSGDLEGPLGEAVSDATPDDPENASATDAGGDTQDG